MKGSLYQNLQRTANSQGVAQRFINKRTKWCKSSKSMCDWTEKKK